MTRVPKHTDCNLKMSGICSLLGPGGSPWSELLQVTALPLHTSSLLPARRRVPISCSSSVQQQRCCREAVNSPYTPLPPNSLCRFPTLCQWKKRWRWGTFLFHLLVAVSIAVKLWMTACFLCRCCSRLERLLCCVLILVSPAASRWPGKNWYWIYSL